MHRALDRAAQSCSASCLLTIAALCSPSLPLWVPLALTACPPHGRPSPRSVIGLYRLPILGDNAPLSAHRPAAPLPSYFACDRQSTVQHWRHTRTTCSHSLFGYVRVASLLPAVPPNLQNRNAQRAFRERKEKVLRDLEDKVSELNKINEDQVNENQSECGFELGHGFAVDTNLSPRSSLQTSRSS